MNCCEIEKAPFKVIGRRRTTPSGGGTWGICKSDGSIEKIQEIGGKDCAFLGLCFGFDSEGNNDYMVGIETNHDRVPGLEEFTYPQSKWLIFEASGAISENALGNTWNRIYGEFLPEHPYKKADLPTIELYHEWNEAENICKVEIWIPVES